MRAPNGQVCRFGDSRQVAVVVAGDIVWRCEKIFENSVRTRTPVTFEFRDDELDHLQQFYPTIKSETLRVKNFLNCVILMHKKMPYEVSSILYLVWTNKFSCRIVHELPVFG